jgi:putative spermidine/putrescine transport system permease protein
MASTACLVGHHDPIWVAAMTAGRSIRWGQLLLAGFTLIVVLYLVFPLLITVPISFSASRLVEFPPPGYSAQWYGEFFSTERWTDALLLSFQVGLMTSLLATVLGTLAAIPMARVQFRGKNVINTLLLLPMVVPIIVLAVGTYLFYAQLKILGSLPGLVFAHTVLALPFVVTIAAATLKGFDESLEWAALSLGASRLRTFWSVTLPLIRPGIVVGAFFAFLTSFDELLLVLFVGGSRYTLPRLLWDVVRSELSPVLAVVSTLLIGLSAAFVLLVALLGQRSVTAPTRAKR